VVWGAEAVRRVAKYGLGTGVPSIGQIAMGMGIIAAMFGLAIVKAVSQNPNICRPNSCYNNCICIGFL
jgi:tetrahydromethanopterin S-methyltransferase subunit C